MVKSVSCCCVWASQLFSDLVTNASDIYTHTYYAWSCRLSLPVNQPNGKLPAPFIYLDAQLSITGYWVSSNNSNSQQQPNASYRQTNKLLPSVSLSTRVITTRNRIYTWYFKYASNVPTVLCMSNGLICGYIYLVSEVWGCYTCNSVHGSTYHYHYCWWIVKQFNILWQYQMYYT